MAREPIRTTRESEIFRDPPGSGNYSSSIGAAQGIELFSGSGRVRRARPTKTVFEPARQVPVFAETDVLVVGGGPAGTAAAVAAARLGADVLLVERYNHLGGLSTGGLVIWIDRMTDWSGQHIIRGIAERLPKDAIQGPSRAEWGNRDADCELTRAQLDRGQILDIDRAVSRQPRPEEQRHIVAPRHERLLKEFYPIAARSHEVRERLRLVAAVPAEEASIADNFVQSERSRASLRAAREWPNPLPLKIFFAEDRTACRTR